MENSTELNQSQAALQMAKEWQIEDNIIGVCFDTTAGNTGARQGAAILIESELKRALLYLACCHHHCELHIKHAFTALRGERDRPDEPIFKRFQSDYSSFDIDYSNLTLFEWPADQLSRVWIQAKSVLTWAEQCLKENTFPREDYRELVQLTVVYLGGKVTSFRFMSQSIYLLKIELLSHLFHMLPEERRIVHRMADFIALFYANLFLRSRISVFDPNDDFHFLASMLWYQEEDDQIATAVLASIKRHLWYLAEELVVLALFNESLSDFTRMLMAKKLFDTRRPTSFKPGKPTFPTIDLDTPPLFHQFIGPRSWLLFSILQLNRSQDWLQLPPTFWPLMSDYCYARDFVKRLEVTNDCAERGVKLIGDFKDYTDEETQRQFLLQVVEDHRKNIPSMLKKNVNSVKKKYIVRGISNKFIENLRRIFKSFNHGDP